MKKQNLSWQQIEDCCIQLAREIYKSNFKIDYIVGLSRGGTIPATMLSHFLNVKMQTLDISLRDKMMQTMSNAWIAEDAFARKLNILIVDDINDTGATFNHIKYDWEISCLNHDALWDKVWHHNVKFASLITKSTSAVQSDFTAIEVNALDNDIWYNFPWENFWISTLKDL
jgi:hypoxanthine phosphoribosyltransferase